MEGREFSLEFMHEASIIRRHLEGLGARTVLDLGSGLGYLGYLLRPLGYSFTGLDIDCSRSLIECIEHDLTKTPYPFRDSSFDAVISQHVIEHLPCSRGVDFVMEASRIARRGVVIVTPNRDYRWLDGDGVYHPEHICMYSVGRLESVFRLVFGSNYRVYGVDNFMYASRRYHKVLAKLHGVVKRVRGYPTLVAVGWKS